MPRSATRLLPSLCATCSPQPRCVRPGFVRPDTVLYSCFVSGCTRASAPGLRDRLVMCAEGAVDVGETRAPRATSCVSWFFGSPSPRACGEDRARDASDPEVRRGCGVASCGRMGFRAAYGAAACGCAGQGREDPRGRSPSSVVAQTNVVSANRFLGRQRARCGSTSAPPPLRYNDSDREGSRCVAWEGRWERGGSTPRDCRASTINLMGSIYVRLFLN